MALISDILLIAGALGAAIYCLVLSRRLRKFNDLEQGVGGAVALMSTQVDDMTKTLVNAQSAAKSSTVSLQELTNRAEESAKHLELLMASLHDLPPTSNVNIPTQNREDSPVATEELQFLRHRSGNKIKGVS
jgi:hypothetical protein